MFGRSRSQSSRLPDDFIEWQVELRRWTAETRQGSPHVGVAPLLTVRHPAAPLGVVSHSIICGLLPREDRLDEKTKEFRQIYEGHVEAGARRVYDHGLDYLKGYYRDTEDFDPASITTLLPEDLPVIDALQAEPRCSLLFYVFDLSDKSLVGRFRCLQINCRAEVLDSGPVYENVWWHNTLFHGTAENCRVVHFRHESTYDTRFGGLREVQA